MTLTLGALALVFGIVFTPPPPHLRQDKDTKTKAELAAALQHTFEELAEAGFSGSVLVVRGEELLLEAAAGLADRAQGRVNKTDTIYDIGSVTKQFTAAAILQLAQNGKLTTDDFLTKFFKDVPAEKQKIRVHHLLTHTSGLPSDVPAGSATTKRDDLVQMCFAAKMKSPPGEHFEYNNIGYLLLGAIVEIVSKQTYEEYVMEHLFTPAGMKSSGFLRTPGVDASRVARGYEGKISYGPGEQGWYSWGLRAAGGVLSTTGDLMRWWTALRGEAVLTKKSREKLFTPYKLDYACGWWVRDDKVHGKVIRHGGNTQGFESEYAHYLDHDLHVTVLCNDRGRRETVVDAILRIVLDKTTAEAKVTFSEAELAPFTGDYEAVLGGKYVVRAVNNALMLEPDDRAVIALEFGSPDAKLEADKKLADRTKKLIGFLEARDSTGIQPMLSKEWPNWNTTVVKAWDNWQNERGKFNKFEILGSKDGTRTLVRLVHDRRTVLWSLSWKKDVLHGWSINGRLPEAARFVANGINTFATLREEGITWKIVFEPGSGAAMQQFKLTGAGVGVQAKRGR
ncbi:MAG: serine hydrolase domain-containing protein [Planctomycetota bacterium]